MKTGAGGGPRPGPYPFPQETHGPYTAFMKANMEGPVSQQQKGPFRVLFCIARTLNATGQSWVTLSLR